MIIGRNESAIHYLTLFIDSVTNPVTASWPASRPAGRQRPKHPLTDPAETPRMPTMSVADSSPEARAPWNHVVVGEDPADGSTNLRNPEDSGALLSSHSGPVVEQ